MSLLAWKEPLGPLDALCSSMFFSVNAAIERLSRAHQQACSGTCPTAKWPQLRPCWELDGRAASPIFFVCPPSSKNQLSPKS